MSSHNALPEQFGRYRILSTLGRGGMGTVYLAHDTMLDRRVALKVPHFERGSHTLLERFRREARAFASIVHPNICRIYDVGEVGGTHFLTMEYVEGKLLSNMVRDGGWWPPSAAAWLVRDLATTMQAVHAHGAVHRDLKPSNVMLRPDGHPIILDFGLARRTDDYDSRLTGEGVLLGTPAYMAPEQMEGDLDAPAQAADIYSLGMILYELLTGRVAFEGRFPIVLARALSEEPRPPTSLRPDLDRALERICLMALAKRPEDRFASMADFATALGAYLQNKGVTSAPALPPPAVSSGRSLAAAPLAASPAPAAFSRRARLWNVVGWPVRLVASLMCWFVSRVGRGSVRPLQPPAAPVSAAPPEPSPQDGEIIDPTATVFRTISPPVASPSSVEHLSAPSVEAPPDSSSLELERTWDGEPRPKAETIPPEQPSTAQPAGAAPPAAAPAASLIDAQFFPRRFGKYELLGKLGQGETGIVYLARHAEQGWQAALKVLPGARFANPACAQRLLREARAGASLRHPNLCQILDAGTEEGEFYLAIEYLEGKTLRHHLQQNNRAFPVPLACYHAYQLFDALAYLARHQVIHRDVKPGNIMVCAGDRLKLMDLGLAKVPDPEERRLTLSGIILGTPAYMAPEQVVDASRATAASDLYAAGATLFEMLTGSTPFQGDSPLALMHKVQAEAPPDPRRQRPDLPEALSQIIVRLLAKVPERRPGHEEVLAVLGSVCQGLAPLLPEAPAPRRSDAAVVTAIQKVSMVARIDEAAERIIHEDADDLAALLPTEEDKIRLGDYFLEERIGPRSAVNTYRARHFLAGHPYIVRLLPLALSQLAPERLRGLVGQRAQLMQISMQSPYLTRLLSVSKTQLREGTFNTLYYTVEDFVRGKSLHELIATPRLEAGDIEKCLTDAVRGLWTLHKNGIMHGNLHPGKLYLDADGGLLRLADLSYARRLEAPPEAADSTGPSAINDLDWLGDSQARRRQYVAPEVLCDGEPAGLLTEQYSLGVVFVELLARRFLRTHANDLKLMKLVQQDLQDCLFEIADSFPRLGKVLRKMVAINPKARYPDLAAVLDGLAQPNRPRKQARQSAPPPAPVPGTAYDIFVSYRRRTGADIARAIVERLKKKDVRPFLDVDSLNSGTFDDRLLTYIECTPNFMVILSEGSLDRCADEEDWLRREINHAIQTRRNIVPVMMPRFQWPKDGELPEELATLPRYNSLPYQHDYFDEFINKLVKFLRLRNEHGV